MFKNNPIPSISTLHQEKHIKESSKHDIFNIVLNKIIQKIIYTNRHTDQTYIIYEIPQILIGYPQYDMKSCLLFIMNRLSNNDYIVEFVQPFYLYIDWGSNTSLEGRAEISLGISNKHKNKLTSQTKALLNKFPNTSQVEFVYEDKLLKQQNHKPKRLKKNNKK